MSGVRFEYADEAVEPGSLVHGDAAASNLYQGPFILPLAAQIEEQGDPLQARSSSPSDGWRTRVGQSWRSASRGTRRTAWSASASAAARRRRLRIPSSPPPPWAATSSACGPTSPSRCPLQGQGGP